MAQDTRGDRAVTRLNLWLSYGTVRQSHQVERRPLEGRLEKEVQLMEVDAAARSPPHKLVQEHRLQERSARHPIGWIALPALPALGLWL